MSYSDVPGDRFFMPSNKVKIPGSPSQRNRAYFESSPPSEQCKAFITAFTEVQYASSLPVPLAARTCFSLGRFRVSAVMKQHAFIFTSRTVTCFEYVTAHFQGRLSLSFCERSISNFLTHG